MPTYPSTSTSPYSSLLLSSTTLSEKGDGICGENFLPSTPLDTHISGRGIDMVFLREKWGNPTATWVGLKAGYNTVHHSHLDLGSFVLEISGIRWGIDLGKDSYGLKKYNSHLLKSPRWNYLRPSNKGHNVISVGEEEEEVEEEEEEEGGGRGGKGKGVGGKEGKEGTKERWNRPGEGSVQCLNVMAPITRFKSSPTRSHAVVDLSACYTWESTKKDKYGENSNPRSIYRGIALVNNRKDVFLRDEICVHGSYFNHKKGKVKDVDDYNFPIIWRMYTEAMIEIDEKYDGKIAFLHQNGKTIRVEIMPSSSKIARFTTTSATPNSLKYMVGKDKEDGSTSIDIIPNNKNDSKKEKKHKQENNSEKPNTEDPNVGISVLKIEMMMMKNRKCEMNCNGLGSCIGGDVTQCNTMVISVLFSSCENENENEEGEKEKAKGDERKLNSMLPRNEDDAPLVNWERIVRLIE